MREQYLHRIYRLKLLHLGAALALVGILTSIFADWLSETTVHSLGRPLEKNDHKFTGGWEYLGLGGWRKHLRITAWRPKHKGSHVGFQVPYGCEYPYRLAKKCK